MQERYSRPKINKDKLLISALTPAITGVFTVASAIHEGNKRFLAEQAFALTRVDGQLPNFMKWTSWFLSRIGQKEIEQAIVQGRKARALREYRDIPPVFWETIDKLHLK